MVNILMGPPIDCCRDQVFLQANLKVSIVRVFLTKRLWKCLNLILDYCRKLALLQTQVHDRCFVPQDDLHK